MTDFEEINIDTSLENNSFKSRENVLKMPTRTVIKYLNNLNKK